MALLLALIALAPLGPVTGQQPSLPAACEALAFSTEEDFITHGPPPPDQNPYISDGDLLGGNCTFCARNAALLSAFGVDGDLGLDAADVIDADGFLVAFSTELDNDGDFPFSEGDLLMTNGVVIANMALTHRFQLCERVDQEQPEENHGYWFEDDVIRWQEVIPTLDNIAAIDLQVDRSGNPGNILVEVRTPNGTLLDQSIIPEGDVAITGWVRADFSPPVSVTPGVKVRIHVYTDQDSPSPANRYNWRGDSSSTYCPSCETDVSNSWPDFRYAFRTYGFAPCDPGEGTLGPPRYDLGLDAVHLVGTRQGIRGFIDAVDEAGYGREHWMTHPDELAGMLAQYEVDIWFSTEGTWSPGGLRGFLDGDLLSARAGIVVARMRDLLPPGVPAGIPQRGVDFGLDGAASDRTGGRERIHFSTEILYDRGFSFTDGDVLLAGNGVVHTHKSLVQCFEPKANFLGLDAFHKAIEEMPNGIYLPVVLKALSQTSP
jgi:hypothetical protein